MKKVRLIVSGRVQGVGFRYSTFTLAQSLGDIYGRVWNNDDGTVEILAQSDDSAKMAKFIFGELELSTKTENPITSENIICHNGCKIMHK